MVLIARKQPEPAWTNQWPGAPVVKRARPIRRQQAGLLASGAEARGAHCHGGSHSPCMRGRPVWGPKQTPESVTSHALGVPGVCLKHSAFWHQLCSPKDHELTLWEEPPALVGVPLGGPVEGETPDMQCASLSSRPGPTRGAGPPSAKSASLLFFWTPWLLSLLL